MGLGGSSRTSSLAQGTRKTTDQARACCCDPSSFLPTLLAQHGHGQRPWELTKWALALGRCRPRGLGCRGHCQGSREMETQSTARRQCQPCGLEAPTLILGPPEWRRRGCVPVPSPGPERCVLSTSCIPAVVMGTHPAQPRAGRPPRGWAWPTAEEPHSRARPEMLTCEPDGPIFEASEFSGVRYAALV